MQIITRDGDTVDAICHRHLSQTAAVTERVLDDNPGLADYGPVLPAGISVMLPDDVANEKPQAKLIRLWD